MRVFPAMSQVIKEFVRQTLGCDCPQEVFNFIDCQRIVKIDENTKPDYQINIGNRLLIFVVMIDKTDSLKKIIPNLVQAGIKKRNENKFNRFRLVLLTTKTNDTAQQAKVIFNSILTDDKTHLHIIDVNDFPKI